MDTSRRLEAEVRDFLNRGRTSSGRRQTVSYMERGNTAIGLIQTPGNVIKTTFLNKRASITPLPTRKLTHVHDRRRRSSGYSKRRYSSSSDDAFRAVPMTSRQLVRYASEPGSMRRGSIVPPGRSSRTPSFGGTKRRNSSVFGISEEDGRKRSLKAKFKMAVRLTIFCSRTFKDHCLRINEQNDELAPYIKRLHFHEEDNSDLLIDLSKFKANRQMRIPEETKRILSKEVSERSEKEIYTVTLALKNIKCFAEYPKRMQNKLAEVGLYEKYESKRVIIRQGHPASAFYFILSGAVVVMVMDEDSKYARPVAHLYKGQTFGELAIINGTQRNSTVIAKETCEFMSISQKDYHKIFMAGGVKNINDPDQEVFLKSLNCLAGWPIGIMQHYLTKCQFLFFKNGDVIVRDSNHSDWLIIVKSGSIRVLKKLKRVDAFEWKKKQPIEPMNNSTRRDIVLKRMEWRRVLPELGIPLQNKNATDNVTEFLGNGKPVPFVHPDYSDDETISSARSEPATKKTPQIPNLWPFKVNISEFESGRYIEDHRDPGQSRSLASRGEQGGRTDDDSYGRRLNRLTIHQNLRGRDRSNSVVKEEEDELLGYQPHIRTIIEDIDGTVNTNDYDTKPADINPEFVHVQTLTKGQVFGLTDLIIGGQPSFSVVSHGADCLLINKQFYLEHASEKLLRDMRQELCPYPTEEELQQRLQVSVDWQAYKKTMLIESVENVTTKRLMRSSLKGTKTQEAFAY